MRRDVVFREQASFRNEEVLRLFDQVFGEEIDPSLGERIAQEIGAADAAFDPARDLLVTAEMEGKLVGALAVTHQDFPPPPACRFAWLAVDPATRGRGIGRELVFRGIETCRQRRVGLLRAHTFALSPAAPRLLWMHGFRVVNLAAVSVGGRSRESLQFEKRLTPPSV